MIFSITIFFKIFSKYKVFYRRKFVILIKIAVNIKHIFHFTNLTVGVSHMTSKVVRSSLDRARYVSLQPAGTETVLS